MYYLTNKFKIQSLNIELMKRFQKTLYIKLKKALNMITKKEEIGSKSIEMKYRNKRKNNLIR